jgi:hypothetical protein
MPFDGTSAEMRLGMGQLTLKPSPAVKREAEEDWADG